jgi:hypothetical protein
MNHNDSLNNPTSFDRDPALPQFSEREYNVIERALYVSVEQYKKAQTAREGNHDRVATCFDQQAAEAEALRIRIEQRA